MTTRNKKDIWVEMSIREIWSQTHFADIAYSNIDPKAIKGTDAVFSSIHSFLAHCAIVSKLLKASDDSGSKTVGGILGILDSSLIHKRKFRNNLEHYDKELKGWIKKYPADVMIATYNIMPRSAISGNVLFVNNYDPTINTFTFVNKDFDLGKMHAEAMRINAIADKWVKDIESGNIKPPFI